MMLNRCFHILVFCLAYCSLFSQKKWDGEAGDGVWENPLNWSGNLLPTSSDDVVLDNSLVANSYDVFISGTAGVVACHSLLIIPAIPNSIRLIVPSTNILPTAFATTATGYSIQLKEGAVLVNASGASSGTVLSITDSMKIENNARYIHRCPRGNAVILNSVSSSTGTEKGIIEFDVPVVSGSYIVSLTNRTFGALIFSSHSNNGPITYTSNGNNRVLIRGDLLIDSLVSLSVGFNDTIWVKGNTTHRGNLFNLSNNGNPTVLALEGNLFVNAGSTVSETNTAQPVVLFCGSNNQECHVQGSILNEVQFKLQKTGSVILSSPLNLPFHLEIKRGVFKTDSLNLLTLNAIGKIITDTLLADSNYIDGPVRKMGLNATDHFLFPVGKGNKMRWLELKNATGDFTVEFMKANPYSFGAGMNGIDHISSIEYWAVESSSAAAAKVELSFDNVNSGGVTDVASLRVARFNSSWQNEGNTGTTGSAGASGSVISNSITDFSKPMRNLTLASMLPHANPLPIRTIHLIVQRSGGGLIFEWSIEPGWKGKKFVIQYSTDQVQYNNIAEEEYMMGKSAYTHRSSFAGGTGCYRIKALAEDDVFYSNIVSLAAFAVADTLSIRSNSIFRSNIISISIDSKRTGKLRVELIDVAGQRLCSREYRVYKGSQVLRWNVPSSLPAAQYFLAGQFDGVPLKVQRMIKE